MKQFIADVEIFAVSFQTESLREERRPPIRVARLRASVPLLKVPWRVAFALLLFLPFGASPHSTPSSPPPAPAADVGYNLNTFSSSFMPGTIDLSAEETSGFQWYRWHFFGGPPAASEGISPGGSNITLGSTKGTSITTAAPAHNGRSKFVGTAFGGGAYFEAVFKFDPQAVVRAHAAVWPSFWSMSVEHLAGLAAEQWDGQPPGYVHFMEPDFFEYDVWSISPKVSYGGAIHEWFGIYKKTCPNEFCQVSNGKGSNFLNFVSEVPSKTVFSEYHRFGFLWVPATYSRDGYATYYFDGKPTNTTVHWTKYRDEAPPPGNAAWTFGIIDRQHLALILGTGAGQPLTIKSVNVWQSSDSENWRR